MKLMVGSVAWRAYEAPHMYSLFQLMSRPGVVFCPRDGDALVERARAIVATQFLASDCDVLLTIDSDIAFQADDAFRVAEAAVTHNLACGLYVTRHKTICRPTSVLEPNVTVDLSSSEPVAIRWPAGGFLATHRRVFEALIATGEYPLCHPKEAWAFRPFYTPFVVEDDQGDPILLSEDYAFGERARRAGFPCYAVPSVRLLHYGVYGYGVDDIPAREPRSLKAMTFLSNSRYRLDVAQLAPTPETTPLPEGEPSEPVAVA